MRAERRKGLRRNIDRICWIATGSDSDPQECNLRDISDHGAKLACNEPAKYPDKFILLLTLDGNAARHCKVVWRSDKEMAVHFLGKVYRKPSEVAALEV